jgi:putative ABC transport system permease protein
MELFSPWQVSVCALCLALDLTHFISKLLCEVAPTDPITFGTVPLLLLLASYIPARRATKVDPMVALRYE